MDVRNICFILSFFLPLVLKAQQSGISETQLSDYQHFKGVLEKETGNAADNFEEGYDPVLHPAVLPDSLCCFPVTRKGEVFGIGMSDPGMDEESGFRLASDRALAITAIMTGAGIKSLVDNFSSEREYSSGDAFVTKYLNYFRISANKRLDTGNVQIVGTFRTAFDETLVLTIYNLQDSSVGTPVSIEAEVYQVERQKGNTYSAEERIGFTIIYDSVDQGPVTDYSIYARNNLFEIISRPLGEPYEFPYRNYRYSMENRGSDSITGFSSRLNYGLWKSFLELFLQEAYMVAQRSDIHIKQVGDAYADNTRHLSREIYTDAPVFAIQGIRVYNNHLFIHFNQLHNHGTDQ